MLVSFVLVMGKTDGTSVNRTTIKFIDSVGHFTKTICFIKMFSIRTQNRFLSFIQSMLNKYGLFWPLILLYQPHQPLNGNFGISIWMVPLWWYNPYGGQSANVLSITPGAENSPFWQIVLTHTGNLLPDTAFCCSDSVKTHQNSVKFGLKYRHACRCNCHVVKRIHPHVTYMYSCHFHHEFPEF